MLIQKHVQEEKSVNGKYTRVPLSVSNKKISASNSKIDLAEQILPYLQ